MNIEQKYQGKMANKILCIGASTYNTGTPQLISKALKNTSLLDDWSVIWTVHRYFEMHQDQELYKIKINQDFTEINDCLIFIDKHFNYSIEQGCLYILPDSFWLSQDSQRRVIPRIIIDQNLLTIQASNLEEIYQEDCDYVENVKNATDEQYLPCIDKIMIQLAENNTAETAGLLLAGCGADGAKGMLAIKKKGGKTAVQNPDECYRQSNRDTSSMPKAAIAEADNEGITHEIISLNVHTNKNTRVRDDIKTLTEWLESIKTS